MHAEDLVVDHHGQCQEVEEVREIVPDVSGAVLTRALRVEAVGLCDAAGLVVASDQVHALWVA